MENRFIWIEENKALDIVYNSMYDFRKDRVTIRLKNCMIGELNLGCKDVDELIIENCIVGKFFVSYSVFYGSVVIRNSIFKEEFHFSDGGHSKMETRLEGNIFCDFADFMDEVFDGFVTVENNIFLGETNLLSDVGTNFQVEFNGGRKIEGNIGITGSDNQMKKS
jgi:hypothetical protein